MKALLFKTAISAALIVAVLHFNNIDGIVQRMRDADLELIGLAFGISIATSFVHAFRWRLVIRAAGDAMTYARAVRIAIIGYFFNHFLPTSLGGDVYRIWHTHKHGTALANATNAVILDRIVALVALLLMMLASLPWLFELIIDSVVRWGLILAITIGLASVAILMCSAHFPRSLRRWKPLSLFMELSTHARRVFLLPRYGVPAIALSVIMHVIFVLMVFVTAVALTINVSFITCLLLVPPIILVTMLPFSVAGWGLREGAMVSAFGYINVSPADSFALSVFTGLVVTAASLPGALLWLLTDDEPR